MKISLYLFKMLMVYGPPTSTMASIQDKTTNEIFHEPLVNLIRKLRELGLKELQMAVYAGLVIVQSEIPSVMKAEYGERIKNVQVRDI